MLILFYYAKYPSKTTVYIYIRFELLSFNKIFYTKLIYYTHLLNCLSQKSPTR